MQDKALQSEKMQDNPAKSRTVGNSALSKIIFLAPDFNIYYLLGFFHCIFLTILQLTKPIIGIGLLPFQNSQLQQTLAITKKIQWQHNIFM